MKFRLKDYPDIRKEVEAMDLTELIRAIIVPNMRVGDAIPRNTRSVFIHAATMEQAKDISRQVNTDRKAPALIAADVESSAGTAIVGAIKFPTMRSVCEGGDPRLAYEMGVVSAKEMNCAGYHWAFGPVVDILGNPLSPVVSLRTAGGDPDDVITYCGSFMRGLQDNGIIATLKHFPGDGYCIDDQHVTVAENPLSQEQWWATFGKVYGELIGQGAMTIMPGHISLPAFDEPDEYGLYPPATVSKRILTGLLRDKLGFEGILVSDATEMGGFAGYTNLYHGCAAFLEAGGDCLLFIHESETFIKGIEQCIAEGRLTMQTLRDRAYRMCCFTKQYFETHSPVPSDVSCDRVAAEKLAEKVTRGGIKVIRDRKGVLPVELSDKRVAHIVIHNYWFKKFEHPEALTEELSKWAASVEEFRDPGPVKLEQIARSGDYDLIVCSVFEAPEWAVNTAKLCGVAARNMMRGWMKLDTPVVFVVWQSVCFAETYKAVADTVINTHGITKHTPKAIVDKLQGK